METKVCPSSRAEWRSWLSENHLTEKEVWLYYYKKHTDKPTVSYRDSVEEALCFGWIDGIKKTIDDERYCHRFSPRKTGSKWSPLNIELAKRMIDLGKMTPAGQTAFEQRETYDEKFLEARRKKEFTLSPEIKKALKENHTAWENFNNLAPSYRKQYVGWLTSAKKPETRTKRLEQALRLLEQSKKLEMK